MNAKTSKIDIAGTPQLAVPTAHEAVARVNRWLHRAIGTAVHAAAATFDPATFEHGLLMADPDHSKDEDRFLLLGLSARLRLLVVCHTY